MRLLLILLALLALEARADSLCPSAWLTAQAPNANGTTTAWTGTCSSDPRDGGGGFIQFLTPNRANTLMAGGLINGGLIDATPGKEQTDVEIDMLLDGKWGNTISFNGRYPGMNPGINVWPPDVYYIGGPSNRFAGISLTEVPCPHAIPGASSCVRMVGPVPGYIPVYR